MINKPTVSIKVSKKQVKANTEHHGGFLGTLLGLASKVLPTLLGGLATGLISGGIEKAVSGHRVGGNGLSVQIWSLPKGNTNSFTATTEKALWCKWW